LVVDDEPANRRLLRACLGKTYDVYDVEGAAPALDLLDRQAIDLCLLDVMMPGMSGFDLCREIKRRQRDYLPVVLLTGLGRQDDRNAGLLAGADEFLTKPFNRHELLLRVRALVRLREQDQQVRRQLTVLTAQEKHTRQKMKELEDLGAMKDDLVSLMVHDLRNPLTGIVGFLDLLSEDAPDPELRRDAMAALEASGRVRETLDDLLCVRMLETSSLTLNRERLRAESVVGDATTSLRGAARARHVEIRTRAESNDLMVDGDRKLVRRAVENLLSNALKYAPEGSVVSAAIRHAGSDVEIEVSDRGRGVPDAAKQQVFRKFASVEAARGEARRGVGLGLYLVSLVAMAHGGSAVVRDGKDGGAAFSLYIPRAADLASADGRELG
jgi:signal transduction histidine kinase